MEGYLWANLPLDRALASFRIFRSNMLIRRSLPGRGGSGWGGGCRFIAAKEMSGPVWCDGDEVFDLDDADPPYDESLQHEADDVMTYGSRLSTV